MADLSTLFPKVNLPTIAAATEKYHAVFEDLPLEEWTRNGTFMARWENGVRIAFAPRQKYASIYFQGVNATELYKAMGGLCPSGRVTINLYYGEEVDAELIRFVIAKAISEGPRK